MARRFDIVREIRRQYRRFNASGTQLTVQLQSLTTPDANPIEHFIASVNDLFEHALQYVGDVDMVGIAIHNKSNQKDKPICISFRRRDQIFVDAVWGVFEKVPSQTLDSTLSRRSQWCCIRLRCPRFWLRGYQYHGTSEFGTGPFKEEYSTGQIRNELSGTRPNNRNCESNQGSELQGIHAWAKNIPQSRPATCDDRYQP